MLGNIGMMLHTGDLTMDEIVRFAKATELLGYEGFWLTEESGKEAFATLSVLARETRRINLGTSILNFYSRTPMLLAMGASTIYRMSGGRFKHFGLGSGGIGFMEQGHGIKMERPLARGATARSNSHLSLGIGTADGRISGACGRRFDHQLAHRRILRDVRRHH